MAPPDNDDQSAADLIDTVLTAPGSGVVRLAGQNASIAQQRAMQPQAQGPMSDTTLTQIIGQKISSSQQWFGSSRLASDRVKADQYYRGEPLGNEIEGRSQVVSRDVAEAIDGLMPSLMRVFASGDQVVVMEPTRPDAEEAAKQATDYLNWTFLQQNNGFEVLYTWFKDALLKRNGIVISYYEVRHKRQKDSYEGLTEPQYQILARDPTYQMVDCKQYPDQSAPPQPMMNQMTGQPVIDPSTGQPHMQPPPTLYDCTVVTIKPVKKLVVENVPPDEFFIENRAVGLAPATFMGRMRKLPISDLIELGLPYDKVIDLPAGDTPEYSLERQERFNPDSQMPFDEDGNYLEPTMRKVWVTEVYMRVDYDGDGYAEWRKITLGGSPSLSGSVVLANEEIDDQPFASITPKPDPHRFIGFSIYDEAKDIQEIKTVLSRGTLDCIYLANSPRTGVVEGQVNLDDLLDSRVGGIVRLKNPNALVNIPTVNAAPQAMEAINYWDQVREKRTGIAPAAAGLDPNILNSSATGANILDNNNQLRPELIARVFAETGVKQLFRRIFELTCQHEDQSKMVRLRGKWVNIDPRDWKDRMDVTVSVGIGLGDKTKQLNAVMAAMNVDQKIIDLQKGMNGPFLTPANIYAKLEKFVEALGWKSVNPYYTNPADAPPAPPPQPTPDQVHETAMAQAEIAVAQAKAQSDQATDQYRIDAEMQRDMIKAKMDSETKIIVAKIMAGAKGADGQDDPSVPDVDTENHTVGPSMTELMATVIQQMQQTLGGLQQSHQALTAAITKPKRIVSDQSGNIVGVE